MKPNIGRDCVIGGYGDARPNIEQPDALNSSIALVGMESEIPDNTIIGRNCIVYPDVRSVDFQGRRNISDGECVHPTLHKL
jgi:acetyltransferase-like isoleucine patch superfamily enzyme